MDRNRQGTRPSHPRAARPPRLRLSVSAERLPARARLFLSHARHFDRREKSLFSFPISSFCFLVSLFAACHTFAQPALMAHRPCTLTRSPQWESLQVRRVQAGWKARVENVRKVVCVGRGVCRALGPGGLRSVLASLYAVQTWRGMYLRTRVAFSRKSV